MKSSQKNSGKPAVDCVGLVLVSDSADFLCTTDGKLSV